MKKGQYNKSSLIILVIVFLILFFGFFALKQIFRGVDKIISNTKEVFAISDNYNVQLYDINFNETIFIPRGQKITIINTKIANEDNVYYKTTYNNEQYLINADNISDNEKDVVKETELYVRTPATFYEKNNDITIKGLINKGEKVEVLDYDFVLEDGIVNMYKVKYDDREGYVYGKYLVNNLTDANRHYDEEGIYKIHANRTNTLRGGSAANLDYYPYPKVSFQDNVMPKDVRSLYMNAGVIRNVDEYIKLAKESGINAIVVDIKDNTAPGYPAKAMEEYSPTNYERALNSYENYRNAIKKIKDAGLYVIGRITVFKDSYYTKDHPEDAILDNYGQPYNHDNSYWPSAYRRNVWEFNVQLAIESVIEMGFNEIQFDYVRFPDRTGTLEKEGKINLNNPYDEEKAQAIQRFLMYATDEIHNVNAYVSADVFGESAHLYVTAYGQYWPAISNVVDVISGMPYPDHFSKYEYKFTKPVWTIPYELIYFWGSNYVAKRQQEIPTPAIVRTWIQAYDTYKDPKTIYDSHMVSEEIRALYDAGLDGGFITWNGSSNLSKYQSISSAFGKEY